MHTTLGRAQSARERQRAVDRAALRAVQRAGRGAHRGLSSPTFIAQASQQLCVCVQVLDVAKSLLALTSANADVRFDADADAGAYQTRKFCRSVGKLHTHTSTHTHARWQTQVCVHFFFWHFALILFLLWFFFVFVSVFLFFLEAFKLNSCCVYVCVFGICKLSLMQYDVCVCVCVYMATSRDIPFAQPACLGEGYSLEQIISNRNQSKHRYLYICIYIYICNCIGACVANQPI